ncbi:MAG TPA: LLM class flavin-dependent oxidoreductase [Chloroflexota bacterium]|jgi:alkanesulfonate monooxygenase SsuD/methylene tetrahydromethanopterin reductase-like flavin-dependent oxidoreductase (luciferase family)|nr:LLM class flavin-dependent oxidoreductase [Chloroflexota bacterium]
MGLRFGYFTLSDNSVGYGERRRDPGDLILEVVNQAIAAEGLGYNSAWLPEHHFGLFGVLPTPAQALTFIAARTTTIKLAPATVLLPCTQPLRTAEEYAVLDLLSGGRAIFSAGRGYDEREYAGFEIPFDESRTRFDEELLIVRKAWTESDWTFPNGKHHRITEPINVVPKPVQKPHPPVYVACFSEPTMRMAAEQGFNIIFAPFAASMMFGSLADAVSKFKGLAAAAGYPNSTAMCSYFTCIADTPAEKLKAQERLLYYLTNFIPAVPTDPDKTPPHIRYFIDIAERVKKMRAEDLGERSIVSGTVQEVIRQFEQVEAAGIEEVICYFNFGLLSHAETMQQMERVSREVMPHFSRAAAVV